MKLKGFYPSSLYLSHIHKPYNLYILQLKKIWEILIEYKPGYWGGGRGGGVDLLTWETWTSINDYLRRMMSQPESTSFATENLPAKIIRSRKYPQFLSIDKMNQYLLWKRKTCSGDSESKSFATHIATKKTPKYDMI